MQKINPLRSSDLGKYNQRVILSRIYEARNTGVSQSEMVVETGLKAPTILRIFSSLEEQKLIELFKAEGRENEHVRKGRPPLVYTIRKDALYTVGLEFWVSSISLGVFNFNGDRIFSRIEPLKIGISTQEVIDFIVFLVNEALGSLKIDRNKVIGLGVAAPGQVDVVNRRVISYPRIRGMKNLALADILEEKLKLTVILHNNCSVIALSEYHHGNYDHKGSLFTFLLRAGVNGAFVDEKGIYITSQGATLESGHVPVDPQGPSCSCGIRGCLESHLSSLDKANAKTGQSLFTGFEEKLAKGDRQVEQIAAKAADSLFVATKTIMRFFTPRSFLILANGELLSRCIADNLVKCWSRESDAFVSEAPQVFSNSYNALVSQRGASDLVISYYFS